MALNRFDFLSNSPKNFIFRNTSNKTNIGGFLFLLYIFIVALITAFYICYYITNEDYLVEYTYNVEILEDDEEKFKLKDERYNPYFNFEFIFSIWYEDEQISIVNLPPNLQNYFKIINTTTNQTIPLNTTIKRKVSDINIVILVEKRIKKIKDFSVDIN